MEDTVGKRIAERRKYLGMTQEDLAKRLGYKSKSTINKIELGINDVSQSKLIKIADALCTTPSYLLGWYEEEAINKLKEAAIEKNKIGDINSEIQELTDEQLDKVLQMIKIIKG